LEDGGDAGGRQGGVRAGNTAVSLYGAKKHQYTFVNGKPNHHSIALGDIHQMAQRTHDLLYLGENRYDDTKESFKFVLKTALAFSGSIPATVLDVGCAAGEFPYYLVRVLENSVVHGVDVLPELVQKARTLVPNATFSIGSVLDKDDIDQQYEMVFLVGVHSIFDDINSWLNNLIAWTSPGGTIVIFGLVNPHPVDVFIQARSHGSSPDHREPGWNNFSRATFEEVFDANEEVDGYSFTDFVIPIDLAPHEDDPLRSWTEMHPDGTRYIVNGLGLLHDFKTICIRKKVVGAGV